MRFLFPITLFVLLLAIFGRGLFLNPHQLPFVLLNQPLPTFSLPGIEESDTFSNQDLKNQVSLLHVWATWCTTCQSEQSFLMDLAELNIVPIFAIAYKDDPATVKKFLEKYGDPYQKIGFDQTGQMSVNLGVSGTPETFVVDKQGIIRYKVTGELNKSTWQESVLPLVNELNKK